MGDKKFKTYVSTQYPFLKLGTALKDELGRHVTISFGESAPGLYTAKSAAEEEFIESRDWWKVKIWPFDQGKAAEALKTAAGTPVGEAPAEVEEKTPAITRQLRK
jgi:hypothetical protein